MSKCYFNTYLLYLPMERRRKKVSIKAVILDMDGVLIDSENLWQQAEQDLFGEVGFSLGR